MVGNVKVIRVDDIPLLYAQVKELGIQRIIDERIEVHGNRRGISLGHLIALWLCYLLSESDHRLESVEGWAKENLELLSVLSGQAGLSEKDFTDDRLEQALDYLSKDDNWVGVNIGLNGNFLSVYDLDRMSTVRLDAAPMQGHHKISDSGLFQYGYSKHHDSRLGMLKVMLACVDNEMNSSAYPLAHITVSGEQADDGLYIPVIAECEKTFSDYEGVGRRLYVGDGKLGSIVNRHYIVNNKNDYLVPLSKIQLSGQDRNKEIKDLDSTEIKQVYKEDEKGNKTLVAEGFERQVKESYVDEKDELHEWEERRIFVLSVSYSKAQAHLLESNILKTKELLEDLSISKKGKKKIGNREELDQAIQQVLSKARLNGLIDVQIEEQVHERKIRKYKDRPARVEHFSTFDVTVSRKDQEIVAYKETLGWQVYATTASEEELDFEKCVWKYRYQNRVERRFDDLRNKVVPLIPIFVKKDNRVEALINLLMICLKICTAIEYKVSKQLQAKQKKLDNIYAGNPKRSTANPTAKRLLKVFKGISLVLWGNDTQHRQDIRMTHLSSVQSKIIHLLGFKESIYNELAQTMQMFFSHEKISEI